MFGFKFGENKREVPKSAGESNQAVELSPASRGVLETIARKFNTAFDVLEENIKSAAVVGGTVVLTAISNPAEAKGPDAVTANPDKVISQLEMVRQDAEQLTSYEDQLTQYAIEHGEKFKVNGQAGITSGYKLNFGDTLGVRVYYNDADTTQSGPVGFAVNSRNEIAGRTRDNIIVDGAVALTPEEGGITIHTSPGRMRDGMVDQVVSKVNGVVVAVYDYKNQLNFETKKTTIEVDKTFKDAQGKIKTLKIVGAEANYISASEFMMHAAEVAAQHAIGKSSQNVSAQADTPSFNF